ncbi:MAG: NADH-quinone oxidoreductase subunit N, partial [Bdellovibrionota bacterium]
LIALALVVAGMSLEPREIFGGRFLINPFSGWLKVVFLLATALTLTSGVEFLRNKAEFVTVLLLSLSGMLFLTSSRDLVLLYVSLELATLPLVALAAWKQTARGGEAGFKFLAIGALASGLLLYGIGFLYGLTGQTDFSEISKSLNYESSPMLWVSIGLLTAGVGFKLTLFPFHFWAPDTYEGAPTPVTAFLSVASKATGLVLAAQIFYAVLGSYLPDLTYGLTIVAAVTMTVGNVIAILQSNLKRFMAFSGISQAGYLIMGFLGDQGHDPGAMIYFLLIYVVTNLAVFIVLGTHLEQSRDESLDGLSGLSQNNPLVALAMMIALFGLAGIPPLGGFVSKFFLFSVAARMGHYGLVTVAAINSTVSLYYYLRVVRKMYVEPRLADRAPLVLSPLAAAGLAVATIASVVFGMVPYFFETIGSDASSWMRLIASR